MRRERLAYAVFGVGVFLLFVHTTLPALWQLFGIAEQYPLASTRGLLGLSAGFTPPLGASMMLIAGLLYGSRRNEGGR